MAVKFTVCCLYHRERCYGRLPIEMLQFGRSPGWLTLSVRFASPYSETSIANSIFLPCILNAGGSSTISDFKTIDDFGRVLFPLQVTTSVLKILSAKFRSLTVMGTFLVWFDLTHILTLLICSAPKSWYNFLARTTQSTSLCVNPSTVVAFITLIFRNLTQRPLLLHRYLVTCPSLLVTLKHCGLQLFSQFWPNLMISTHFDHFITMAKSSRSYKKGVYSPCQSGVTIL